MFALSLLLILLALQGRALAAHFLTNLADLVLLSRWEAVAEALAPPTCLERSEPLVGVRWLEAALALDPQHEGTWLQKGRALWLEGRCAEAVDAWREAVARNPRDSAAWLLLVETNPAADIRPDPAIAQEIARHLLFRGDRARMAQEWEWALEWYGRAFSLTPDRQTAARMEAVYLQRGWKEEAIARWQELAALLPDSDPDHWWALGRAAELAEQWEEAARAYGEGVRQAQQPYDFLMRQGYAYERLGDWEQAETVYRRAVEARPEQSWPYLGVGHTLRARQDYEGALAWYRQAENLAPRQLDPKYHIGYTYYLLQDYPTAETYFREALAINPQHAWSAYWLARCLYQMGRQDEAIVWLRSAI
ncbi:MAG: tetratricopeptide repeat protein, partial [Anaerolineae bacterium]